MRKLVGFFFFLLFSTGMLSAQDIHYSQFYASPLTLNPALTGVNDCNYRINANYRNQWSSITSSSAYVTPSISFDINNLAAKLIHKGVASAGILILNDKAGDGSLNNLSVLGSVAYQRSIDPARKMNVSVGLQFGFVQKWYDLSKLTFEDEFNGQTFNPSQGNGETGLSTKTSYVNLNLGGLYTYKPIPTLDLYVGGAAFNLINPSETFYSKGLGNNLSLRGVIHGGARIALNEKFSLMPMFLYMGQAGDREFDIGTQIGYKIPNPNANTTLYAGAYYRWNDAINIMIGGEYKSVRLGISYDVNSSGLSNATGGKGGFELSLSYVGCLSGLILDKPVLWCPRF